jgi:DNA polymerase III subunit gamma/tau
MSALYRTYRPQFFREVIGQDQVKSPLQEALKSGRIVHSYLFSGPRGTGKTTMARIFAKALNCDNRDLNTAEPCGNCESCRGIVAGNSVDILEIDAASNRKIEHVRELKEIIRFTPSQKGKYKIVIIDESHMLTRDASNAFLKTLEEPPSYVIFIFATTEPHKILPTILSRVQRFSFKSLTAVELRKKISNILQSEQIKADPEVTELLVLQAMGGMRDAESILGKLISLNVSPITKQDAYRIIGNYPYFEVYNFIEKLAHKNLEEIIPYVQAISLENDSIQFLTLMLSQVRKLVLYSFAPQSLTTLELLDSETKLIKKISQTITQSDIIALIPLIEKAIERAQTSFIPSLPLEMLSLEFVLRHSTSEDTVSTQTNIQKSAQYTRTTPPSLTPDSLPDIPPQTYKEEPISTFQAPSSEISNTKKDDTAPIDLEMYMPILKGKIASKVRAILPMFEHARFEIDNNHILIIGVSRIAENRLKKHGAFLTDTFNSVLGRKITLSFTHQGSSSAPEGIPLPQTSTNPPQYTQDIPNTPPSHTTISDKKKPTPPQNTQPSSNDIVEDIFKEFL